MAKEKITPKLHFEVGEKVVICGAEIPFTGNRYYPKEKVFTFTTIKEVKEDGSVVVEEGYVYRQSYETYYGCTTLHDYFRINRIPKDGKSYSFNGKAYYYPSNVDNFSTFLPTYLFKFNQSWQDKADKIERAYKEVEEYKINELARKKKKQPYYDAYNRRVAPLEERLHKLKIKAWKEEMCAHCIRNHNGWCAAWNKEIGGYGCSAFDIPKEDK